MFTVSHFHLIDNTELLSTPALLAPVGQIFPGEAEALLPDPQGFPNRIQSIGHGLLWS